MANTDLVTAVTSRDVQGCDTHRLTEQLNACLRDVVAEADGQVHETGTSEADKLQVVLLAR